MNKFTKIFNAVFPIGFALLVLVFVLNVFPQTTMDATFFSACTQLFFGVLMGTQGFFKTRPFYVSRKIEWSLRHRSLSLFPALTFISLGTYQLIKPPELLIATIYVLSVACVILFINKQKRK